MASVKEMSGTYASRLAHHGIIAMAIDYANWGESSGAERHAEVQTQKAKDLIGSELSVKPQGCGCYSAFGHMAYALLVEIFSMLPQKIIVCAL